MMSKWIDNPSNTPAVRVVLHGRDNFGAGFNRSCESRIGGIDDENHAHRTAAKRFRAEIGVRRRLIREPEFRSVHRQTSHHFATLACDTEQLLGIESLLVKLNRTRSSSHRK